MRDQRFLITLQVSPRRMLTWPPHKHVSPWLSSCQQCRTLLGRILCQRRLYGWHSFPTYGLRTQGELQGYCRGVPNSDVAVYSLSVHWPQRGEFKWTLLLLWLIKCEFIWKLHQIHYNFLPLHSSWVKIQIPWSEGLRKVLTFNSFSSLQKSAISGLIGRDVSADPDFATQPLIFTLSCNLRWAGVSPPLWAPRVRHAEVSYSPLCLQNLELIVAK